MNESQFTDITQWQAKTFPTATPVSKLFHLRDEVGELISAIKMLDEDAELEFADCFILLYGAAAAAGFSYQDICDFIEKKFLINQGRTWGEPDENGVINHVDPSQMKLDL